MNDSKTKHPKEKIDFISVCKQTITCSPVPACITDSTGIILFVNKQFETLLKIDNKLLTGQALGHFLRIADEHQTLPNILAQQEPPDFGCVLVANNSERVHIPGLVNIGKIVGDGEFGFVFYFTADANSNAVIPGLEMAFYHLADLLDDSVYITDSDGKFLFINQEFCRRKKLQKEELIGRHYLDFHDARMKNKAKQCFAKVMQGQVSQKKFHYSDKTDIARSYFSNNVPVINQGIITGMLGLSKDTSKQEHLENTLTRYQILEKKISHISKLLLESQNVDLYLKELANIVGAKRAVIFQFNHDFTSMQFLSEWFADDSLRLGNKINKMEVSNYTWGIAQLKSENKIYILDINNLPPQASQEKQLFQSLSVESVITLPLRIDYELFGFVTIDCTSINHNLQDFEIVLLQLMVDILSLYFYQKQVNKKILQTEKRYQDLIEASYGVVCIHRNGKILYVNNAGAQLMAAKSPDELIGKNLQDFIHPEEINALKSRIAQVTEEKIIPLFEQRYYKLNGDLIYVEIASVSIPYQGGTAHLSVIRDITERKKMEMALKESEQRYRVLFELSPMGIVLTNLDGTILKANNKIAQILGYSSAMEMIESGKKIKDYIAPEQLEFDNKNVKELFANGFMKSKEYQFIKTDGNYVTVVVDVILLMDANNKHIASIGVLNDISEKKQITQQLLESEQRYRVLFELSPMGIVLASVDGYILQINRKLADILGYNGPMPSIDKKTTIKEFIIPEQWEMDDKNLEILFTTGFMKTREYTLQRGDKTRVYVEVDALLVRDESNTPVAIIGVVNDISEKKKIYERLLESEKRYRSLAEAAKDMIFIIDRDGTVQYINNFAAQSVGLMPSDIIGKKQAIFFSSNDAQRQQDSLGKVFSTGEAFYIETETVFANRNLWIGSWLVPLKNEEGTVYAVQGISRDITERIKTEQELQKSRANYKMLIESQADLVIKTDADGNILFVSPSYCRTFGKAEQELLGNFFLPPVHEEERENTKLVIQGLFKPPHRCQLEHSLLTKKGWRWFSWILTAILNDNKQVVEIIGVGRDIQEQKNMELQLRASEERFRELAELLPEIVYELDLNNKFTFVNQAALASTGVTRKEFEKGIYAQDMIVPQDRKRMFENMERIIKGEPTRNSEYLALCRDGSTFPVISRSDTIKKNGQIVGFRGIMTNIAQLKQTEAALKSSEERFRDIIERSVDGYYFINKDATLGYMNAAAVQIFGMNKEQINTNGLFAVIKYNSTLVDELEKKFSLIMGGRPEPWCEVQLQRPTGEDFWLGYNSRRVIENGIVKGVEGFIKDITRQKKAEIEVRNSEARYRTLFKNIPFELFNLGQNGQLREANIKFRDKWENLLMKKTEKTANDILLLQTIKTLANKSRKTGQVMQHEFEIYEKDKCINYRMILSPIMITGDDVLGFIGLNIDISDQVWAMEQSKNFSAQLVQMLEEEREHISREIHDSLGQILTALQFEISSASSFLKTNIELAEEKLTASRQTLSEAIVEARNLCAYLRPQLLDDFGLEIALNDYIKDYAKRWNIAVEFKYDNFRGLLTKDIEISLYRVAQEALNNILKYSQTWKVSVNLEKQDGNVVLTIQDYGIGFDINNIDKKEQTHFGLIGMKERIEYLSGEFFIISEPAKGTIIKAIVPIKFKD